MKNTQNHPTTLIRRAFTLIELLVVVAIIALLISILLPALSKAKATADSAVCSANMKGMTMTLSMYVGEFDGRFPLNGILFGKNGANASPPAGPSEPDLQSMRLENGALWPYVTNKAQYLCKTDVSLGLTRNYSPPPPVGLNPPAPIMMQLGAPTLNTKYPIGPQMWTSTIWSKNNTAMPTDVKGYWSYSVNAVLNTQAAFLATVASAGNPYPNFAVTGGIPWGNPLLFTVVTNPHFVTFVEEGSGGATQSPFNDEVFDAPAYNGGDSLTDRHNFGGNVAFLDGSVEHYKAVMFNYVPPANVVTINGIQTPDHQTAMNGSQYTQMFFPDNGHFAYSLPPAQ